MATTEQIAVVSSLVPKITSTSVEDLVRDARWGIINFEAAKSDLGTIFSLAREIGRLPVEIVPDGQFEAIVSSLRGADAAIDRLRSFSLETANPTHERDVIIGVIRESSVMLLTNAVNWLPFLAYRQGDVQKNINDMVNAAQMIRDTYEKATTDAQIASNELTKIVNVAREASASAGVGVFTSDFSAQAAQLKLDAGTWLNATMILAGVTIAVAVGAMFIPAGETPGQIAQFLTSKILALVVLISATVWSGRIYKATMHQATTNLHRANALKTFQAFIQATADEATRNAVLLETTRSIFAIAHSGYLDQADSGPDTGTKVLEIIKSVNGGKHDG
jgi:hypothetical protein